MIAPQAAPLCTDGCVVTCGGAGGGAGCVVTCGGAGGGAGIVGAGTPGCAEAGKDDKSPHRRLVMNVMLESFTAPSGDYGADDPKVTHWGVYDPTIKESLTPPHSSILL